MSKKNKNRDKSAMEDAVINETINGENPEMNDQENDHESDDLPTDPAEELAQEKERHLRLFAEFENYKKRTNKERLDLFKSAGRDVIQSLLPVLDDFDRALAEIEKSKNDSLYEGVLLIQQKLSAILKAKGLEVISVNKGDVFNADDHEAITQIPAPTDDLKGKIIDVVEKGYALGEKTLRYPKVVIGQQ